MKELVVLPRHEDRVSNLQHRYPSRSPARWSRADALDAASHRAAEGRSRRVRAARSSFTASFTQAMSYLVGRTK